MKEPYIPPKRRLTTLAVKRGVTIIFQEIVVNISILYSLDLPSVTLLTVSTDAADPGRRGSIAAARNDWRAAAGSRR